MTLGLSIQPFILLTIHSLHICPRLTWLVSKVDNDTVNHRELGLLGFKIKEWKIHVFEL